MSSSVRPIPETFITERVAAARGRFTPAERKVADIVAGDPRSVAFATVAQVARRARVSGPTVVRFAAKAGFDGYADLQAEAQAEVARELRPAAERIRERRRLDPVAATRDADEHNVRATMEHVDAETFTAAVDVIGDRRRRVLVLSGEATRPVGIVLAAGLDGLREGIVLVEGSEVAAIRHLARSTGGHVVVVIDFRRYERWVLRAAEQAHHNDSVVVAITDSLLSPLAALARHTFVAAAESPGPFDSLVGAMAVANALVTGVARKMRSIATSRIDNLEWAWTEAGVLADR